MVDFTSGYAGGEITIGEEGIIEARGFRTDDLPDIPARALSPGA